MTAKPPTQPGPSPPPPPPFPWLPGVGVVAAVLGVVATGFILFVYAVNAAVAPLIERGLFALDGAMRIALVLTLLLASVRGLLRRRSAFKWFAIWAIAHTIWIPLSAMAFTLIGEPPGDLIPFAPVLLVMGPFASLLLPVTAALYWLTPVVLLIWVWRRRGRRARRSGERGSS